MTVARHNSADGLSENERLVLQLSEGEGLTVPEIANRLGVAYERIDHMLNKAIEKRRLHGT